MLQKKVLIGGIVLDNQDEDLKKKCSFCGMDIPADAKRCSYCGSLLQVNPDRSIFTYPQGGALPSREEKVPDCGRSGMEPLSNGLKVFLTILFAIIPGIGQLAGIITAIVFMNEYDDADRKSFGAALLVASIILFVMTCIVSFVFLLFFSMYIGT
ncbi:MAG: zinc ribbon domain-containing protein [Ruminiclostridium sp.]|nr:zinc ribbon domain-containing protein [Ruminiclostridium sp.]